MPIMDKLLGLATVGSAVANTALFHRFTTSLTNILALTLIGSLMAGLLLIGAYIAIYFGLVHYGLDPIAAIITVAVLLIITIATIFLLIAVRLRQLREISHYSIHSNLPNLSKIPSIVEAFMEGLFSSSHKRP